MVLLPEVLGTHAMDQAFLVLPGKILICELFYDISTGRKGSLGHFTFVVAIFLAHVLNPASFAYTFVSSVLSIARKNSNLRIVL